MPPLFPVGGQADQEWWQACQRNRRMASRLYAALFSVAVIAQLILLSVVVIGNHEDVLLYSVPALTGCAALFELWESLQIRPESPPRSRGVPLLLWLAATVEVCIPPCAIALLALVLGWPTALGSPPVLAVLLILIICPLRLDYRLCLFQGAFSAAAFALLLWLALSPAQGAHALAHQNLTLHFGQGLLFLIGGALAAIVARQSRLRLQEVIRSRIAEADTRHALTARTMDYHRAEETIDQKNELISILSHDLRAPLDGVAGLAELMARAPNQFTTEEIAGYAGEIHRTARNLHELLDNLVAWAELRTAAAARPPQPVNLAATVRPVTRLFAAAVVAKRLHMEIEIEDSAQAMGDALSLATVVRNLLSNAVKFTPNGGRITVRAAASCDHAEIGLIVADSGPGLPAEFAAAAAASDRPAGRRAGLGLALCRQLLDRMPARLEMNSTAAGTEARVWLRAAGDNATATAPAPDSVT